jgi:hypothetical protein
VVIVQPPQLAEFLLALELIIKVGPVSTVWKRPWYSQAFLFSVYPSGNS